MLISVNGVFVSADAYNILISLRLKPWINQQVIHFLFSRTLYNKYKDTGNIKKIDPINIF
jgi:hypothetical protein